MLFYGLTKKNKMNAAQRKYLVDKIQEKTKIRIRALEASRPESISLNVYMLHRVMSNDFEIKSNDELKKIILEKALKAGQEKQYKEDWLGNSWGTATKGNVAFTLQEFFVIPQEYLDMIDERNKKRKEIDQQIHDLSMQMEAIEMRIMLASDKTLQTIINEVDDMGDISLIDTKIKLLN